MPSIALPTRYPISVEAEFSSPRPNPAVACHHRTASPACPAIRGGDSLASGPCASERMRANTGRGVS